MERGQTSRKRETPNKHTEGERQRTKEMRAKQKELETSVGQWPLSKTWNEGLTVRRDREVQEKAWMLMCQKKITSYQG